MARSYTLSMTCQFLLSMKIDKKVKKKDLRFHTYHKYFHPQPSIFPPH